MRITVAEVLNEGNWSYMPWSPRLANDTDFQAWVLTLAERAAAYVEWRVGATVYADVTEPQATVLKEAEMHLCQEQLLLSAAQIADSSALSVTPPLLASGAELRAHAGHRRERAEELLAPYDQGRQRGSRRAVARAGAGTARLPRIQWDEEAGPVSA